jgi:polysaccharide pyruvyl transferase WcaK-like protein
MVRILVDGLGPKPHVSVGSQALVIGAMQILQRRFPKATLYLFSALPEVEDEYLKDSRCKYKIVKRPQGAFNKMRALRKLVREMDAVVSPWGDAFITLPPWLCLHKTLMLKKPSVPMMLFTSSLGPFESGIKTTLAKMALRRFDVLTVRDTVTYDYFKKLGFAETQLVSDSAYVVEPVSHQRVREILKIENIPDNNKDYICINVSVLLFNRMKVKGLDYVAMMQRLINHVKELTGKGVLLLPHQVYSDSLVRKLNVPSEKLQGEGGDDRYASDLVYEGLSDKSGVYQLKNIYSASEYKGIISGTDMFIGGRMHTVIGATSVQVPSAIMQYSHKALGLMRFLGLDNYLWRIDEPVERLLDVVDQLWINRASCKKTLAEKIPGIKEQAYSAADLLADKLHDS